MGDSVDMLGDALVYGLSLFALHRGAKWEAGAALAKGVIILGFFGVIVAEIVQKLLHGVTPSSTLMLTFGSIALIANLTCLALLRRFRSLTGPAGEPGNGVTVHRFLLSVTRRSRTTPSRPS